MTVDFIPSDSARAVAQNYRTAGRDVATRRAEPTHLEAMYSGTGREPKPHAFPHAGDAWSTAHEDYREGKGEYPPEWQNLPGSSGIIFYPSCG